MPMAEGQALSVVQIEAQTSRAAKRIAPGRTYAIIPDSLVVVAIENIAKGTKVSCGEQTHVSGTLTANPDSLQTPQVVEPASTFINSVSGSKEAETSLPANTSSAPPTLKEPEHFQPSSSLQQSTHTSRILETDVAPLPSFDVMNSAAAIVVQDTAASSSVPDTAHDASNESVVNIPNAPTASNVPKFPDRIFQLTAQDFNDLTKRVPFLEPRSHLLYHPDMLDSLIMADLKNICDFMITRFGLNPRGLPSRSARRNMWLLYTQYLLFESIRSYPIDHPLRSRDSAFEARLSEAAELHVINIEQQAREASRKNNITPTNEKSKVTPERARRRHLENQAASIAAASAAAMASSANPVLRNRSKVFGRSVTSEDVRPAFGRLVALVDARTRASQGYWFDTPPSANEREQTRSVESKLTKFVQGIVESIPAHSDVSCCWCAQTLEVALGAKTSEFDLVVTREMIGSVFDNDGKWREDTRLYCMISLGSNHMPYGSTVFVRILGHHFNHACFGPLQLDLGAYMRNFGQPSMEPFPLNLRIQYGSPITSRMVVRMCIFSQRMRTPAEMLQRVYQRAALHSGIAQAEPKFDAFANPGVVMPQISVDKSKELLTSKLLEQSFARVGPSTTVPASDDIELGDLTVSFICPLTLVRIKHPAKGKQCRHKQAFDAETFLSFNAKNLQWKCIVCNQIIQQSDLILDVDMMRLLLKYPNAEKCVIRSDGSDDAYEQPAASAPVSTRANNQKEVKVEVTESSNKRTISEVISLDSDDEDRAAALQRRKAMRLARSAEKPTHDQSLEVIVIDD
ncbi:SUMO ligase siz1 [Chytriomyces hyalinus]|nr:SUMO ligase siz1 [Chytriomyces hyalinus]